MAFTRIFFATDCHGSYTVWRKFVNAGPFYKANVLILGGDTTGKAIVPLVLQSDGSHKSGFLGYNYHLKGEEELAKHEDAIRLSGYYPYRTTEEEMKRMNDDKLADLYKQLVIATWKDWIQFADERLKKNGLICYVAPGNDDPPYVDAVFHDSQTVINVEGKVVTIANNIEMMSCGYSNPTPWHTARELSEDDLFKRLESLALLLRDTTKSIFNIHPPPFDSDLDLAPEIGENMTVRTRAMVPIGSTAVRNIIEKYQPMLSLHGHVHESRGSIKIGKTVCVNPGSEYTAGALLGYIINLDEKGVKSSLAVSG